MTRLEEVIWKWKHAKTEGDALCLGGLLADELEDLDVAIKAFLDNPTGRNRETVADIVGVDLQGG